MGIMWEEDQVRLGSLLEAVKTKPSFPNLTDEYQATDPNLWKTVLEVASGDRLKMTRGDREINSPNKGRGYRNMPANPKGIAWAVKQYKGFGGNFRGQKEALSRMAAGGVEVSAPGPSLHQVMAALGWVRLASATETHCYWEITTEGLRVSKLDR